MLLSRIENQAQQRAGIRCRVPLPLPSPHLLERHGNARDAAALVLGKRGRFTRLSYC